MIYPDLSRTSAIIPESLREFYLQPCPRRRGCVGRASLQTSDATTMNIHRRPCQTCWGLTCRTPRVFICPASAWTLGVPCPRWRYHRPLHACVHVVWLDAFQCLLNRPWWYFNLYPPFSGSSLQEILRSTTHGWCHLLGVTYGLSDCNITINCNLVLKTPKSQLMLLQENWFKPRKDYCGSLYASTTTRQK